MENTNAAVRLSVIQRNRILSDSEDDYTLRSYDSVSDLQASWFWFPFIPFGMITLVDGYPSSGKSSMPVDLMARASRGDELPDGTALPTPINCLYQCSESGNLGVIKRMLQNANASLSRISFIEGESLTVSDPRLGKAIRDNEIKLLVIDPLQEFIGVDMNNAQAVRREMSVLGRFVAQTGCAIVCIGHFRKETHKKALYHGMGSSDLYAIARSVLHVIDQGEESSLRYVKCIKSNNEQAGSTFWYEIIDTGVVKWIGPEDAEAADHLEEQAQSSRSPKLDYAVQSLFELLQESGPIPSAEVQKHIRRLGISDATYRRAKKELDIQSVRLSDGWYLQMDQVD